MKTIKIKNLLFVAILLSMVIFSYGCSGPLQNVAPTPPATFEKLGPATGQACGSLLLVSTAYYFIPVLLNSRVTRAYDSAVASVPDATGLVDVTISEYWVWWVIGTARCYTVTGEAIR